MAWRATDTHEGGGDGYRSESSIEVGDAYGGPGSKPGRRLGDDYFNHIGGFSGVAGTLSAPAGGVVVTGGVTGVLVSVLPAIGG